MSNENLIKSVRGLVRDESAFGKNQAAFVIRALQGKSLTKLHHGHALRCVNRLIANASKKETQAKLAQVLKIVESVETRERYAHATTADASE